MKMFKNCLIIITIALLSGCAANHPQYVSLSNETKKEIKSSNCIVLKKQKELNADNHSTNGVGGMYGVVGILVGGAVDAYRANDAEKMVAQIRKELAGYSVESKLKDGLALSLKNNLWLNTKQFAVKESFDENSELAITQQAGIGADTVVVLKPTYTLSPNFKDLVMTIDVEIYPLSDQLKASAQKTKNGETRPLYRTVVKHTWTLNDKSASAFRAEKNSKLWVENGGERIKTALSQTSVILLNKIEKQLQRPDVVVKYD